MYNVNSHAFERYMFQKTVPCMAYDGKESLTDYQKKARETLSRLLGLPFQKIPLNARVEYETHMEGYTETRFLLESEEGYFVPCHFLVPDGAKLPAPLTVCGMGHGGGMHTCMGRVKRDRDREALEEWPNRAFALRSLEMGRCALVLEPRNFGECSLEGYGTSCTEAAKIALLNGRTALGERVWDVMRALDAVESMFPQADFGDVVMTGSSGGGTTTYYAACLDERIQICAPSSSVCTFEDSIARVPHCMCNHVPGIRKYFEMGDMAAMIAPRPLVIASGRYDPDFPLYGVQRAFDQIQRAYTLAGAGDKCRMVVGSKGHLNYSDELWAEIKTLS